MIHGTMQDFPLTLDKFLTHAARWHADAEVVSAHEHGHIARIGYAELCKRSLRISGLLVELGVSQGECVATLAWNSQAHVEAWYAIMGMGAVCHTLNPRLTAPQLASMVMQSGAKILIVSADLLPLAKSLAERAAVVARLLVIDGDAVSTNAGALSCDQLEQVMDGAPGNVVWGSFDERSPSGLCFTSGTTDAPKGVTYTHRASFLHTLRALQADLMAFTSKDAVLVAVPMFHANAWGLPFALPAAGGKLVLPGRKTDGKSLARLISSENVTVGVGVPTIWLGVAEYVEASDAELPSLKRVIVGGAPIAPALMERIERVLGVTVQTSWGMTELSPLGVIAPPGEEHRSPGLSGRPAVGIDLLITDADGTALSEQRGVEGHLHVRGAAIVDRYFGEEKSATGTAGWFATGDLARIDAKGNLAITGRAKDLIKSGGEWINPAEIEAVVGALPEVALAAVIGRQDTKWGERPILLVEMREGQSLDDETLLSSLNGRVASWWIPDAVVRLPEMPLATTGKIDKIRLRNEHG